MGWVASLAAVWHAGREDAAAAMPGPAAAIIVLGAAQYDGRPSPVLKARLDHAVALWRAGAAPRVIVTGGRRAGDRTTEAAASRHYVVGLGVPDSAVLLESEGQTTEQSLRAAAVMLRQLGRAVPESLPARAVLVSDPFHMLRLGVLARRYGITAYGSPTPTSPISARPRVAWTYLVRESLKVPFTVLLTPPAHDSAN
ncbi:membrane protein [Gemmatimonadetes bacterium T265]|nr:membrane protein [Gemmatimonadetes bacterium T265]